jgi:thioredoxin 1
VRAVPRAGAHGRRARRRLRRRATVAKLNVDDYPAIPGRFNIRAIPTLLLFKDGAVAETIVGVQPKSQIARRLERHL